MSVILLVVGILVTGAGLIAIGFGIPINDSSLGQTLIIAGATGTAGGLVVIGLAAAVSQLTRLADSVRGRTAGRAARQAESPTRAESQPKAVEPLPPELPARATVSEPPARAPAPEVTVRAPAPEIPVRAPAPELTVRAPAPRPAEPRAAPEPRPAPVQQQPAAEPTAVDVSASAIERLRSSLPRPDAVVPETEAGPLSPNGGGHLPAAPAPPPETKPKPAEVAARAQAAVETREPRGPRLDFLFRSRTARPAQPENFDSLWPKRPGRQAEAAGKPAETAKAAAAEDTQPAEATTLPSEVKRAATPAAPAAPGRDETRSVAILKSGVVDGMAYTLYADGSIEAQLPQGTVRFGSIAELRAHIENNS